MKRMLIIAGIAIGAATASACAQSEQKKQAEQTAAAAQQAAAGAQQAAQGAQQAAAGAQQAGQAVAQGLQQMAQGLGQAAQAGAKAVAYESLNDLVPEVSGWERTAPKGKTNSAMGMSVSSTEANYTQGEQRITLEITDTALSPLVLMPFTIMTKAGFEERSDDGYKKAVSIGAYPGYEEWDKSSKHGEVTMIVADRFVVHGEGRNVPSTDVVKQLVQAVNAAKLGALK